MQGPAVNPTYNDPYQLQDDPYQKSLTGAVSYNPEFNAISSLMRRMQRSSRLTQRASQGVDYGKAVGDIVTAYGGPTRFSQLDQESSGGMGKGIADRLISGSDTFAKKAGDLYAQAFGANQFAAGNKQDRNLAIQDPTSASIIEGYGRVADLASQLYEGKQGGGQVAGANQILRQSVQQAQSVSGFYQGQAGAAQEGEAVGAQNFQMKLALNPGLTALAQYGQGGGPGTEVGKPYQMNTISAPYAGGESSMALMGALGGGTAVLFGLPQTSDPTAGFNQNQQQIQANYATGGYNTLRPNDPRRLGTLAQIQAINTGNTQRKVQ